MRSFAVVHDFQGLIGALRERFGLSSVSAGTGIPLARLEGWLRGEDHYSPKAEWALYGFCVEHGVYDVLDMLKPSYDIGGEFDFDAPPLGSDIEPPRIELIDRPTTLAGFHVNFPFGVSASVLTQNWHSIAFYAERGFDILTYKTVRSRRTPPLDPPTWVFVQSDSLPEIRPPFDAPVIADEAHWPESPDAASMANSFGVPSLDPDAWMHDIERAKQTLQPGQVLIVSVIATPPQGDTRQGPLIEDFVRVATYAREAGADIIEANYSCPNTPNSDDPTRELFRDPQLSASLSRAISESIGDTPLFVKIGYMAEPALRDFFRRNARYIKGITAINTIAMPVLTPHSKELFPGRSTAGISGAAIRPYAQEVVRNLVAIRESEGMLDEIALLAVGGVSSVKDIADYLNLGADAVQSCTAALLNPYLAVEARVRFPIVPRGREVSMMVERKNEPRAAVTIKYANDKSKIAWEVHEAIQRVAESLPSETPRLDGRLISLKGPEVEKASYAIFLAGTVIATKHKGVYLVPERTTKILDKLRIPYQEVTS